MAQAANGSLIHHVLGHLLQAIARVGIVHEIFQIFVQTSGTGLHPSNISRVCVEHLPEALAWMLLSPSDLLGAPLIHG